MLTEWDQLVLEFFSNFASEEYQRRSWFGLGETASSPSDQCELVDDLQLDDWLEDNKDSLNFRLVDYIEDFLTDVDALTDLEDEWVVFSSPEWISIRLKASVIRDLLELHFKTLRS